MNLVLSLEKYGILVLLLYMAAIGAAVRWFVLGDQVRRLSPEQRTRLIIVYMGGLTLLSDAVFYYFLRRELGTLVFVPIAAFTMWMGYAMAALVVRLRQEVAGRADSRRSFAIRFGLSMVAFSALTAGALAFAVFQS